MLSNRRVGVFGAAVLLAAGLAPAVAGCGGATAPSTTPGTTTPATTTPATSTTPTAPAMPTAVGVRFAHHPGFDRMVVDFTGGLPAQRDLTTVTRVVADPSGKTLTVAGHVFLQLRLSLAAGHTESGVATVRRTVTTALPNMTQVVVSGDFEGVLDLAVGLQRAAGYHLFTLTDPDRVVLDVTTPYRTVLVRDYFLYQPAFDSGTEPYTRPRYRSVAPPAVARGALERLFAGPTPAEYAAGYRFVASGATGFTDLSVMNGVARVRLTGPVSSHGSTFTVASEVVRTLKQFPTVRYVKVYDAHGTERPYGLSDSIPFSLEP